MTPITYGSTDVNGLKVFYRQSGPSDAPKLLLLHGYPSASHMFRDLIPHLADRFHVIAPDLLGFGQSDMPSRDSFTYTFAALTDVLDGFTDAVGFDRYALYVFDYGAPTGFRLAVRQPERITAIVTQNGNAYTEGLSDGSATPWVYCHTVVSGWSMLRIALRLACVGSFQYAWMGFHPSLRPSV